ncbi:type 1 fimbrial protein [Candidatus Pantoea deserta]|uniref:Type 1 fimbrial protein n=1 Tax=Candidatus Pantoea deserta TaxID=1869313 RepID=A0A3N4PNV1_9GAMM|nr:fimbrial protein [Pantoea deserta]RPE01264.1 type 1 fimbrial protein [Pantoea deserta]
MKKISLIALGLLAAAQVHAASDGTIEFSGNIKGQSCTVTVNNGSGNVVKMPDISISQLAEKTQTAGATTFSINLTDCSTATGDVLAYFEAGANVNADGRLINKGTAANVELELLNNTTPVVAGNLEQQAGLTAVPLSEGAANMTYSARYYATDKAGEGTVQSSVTFSIHYL